MKKLSIFICALFAVATVSAQRVAVLDFNAGVGVSQADVDGLSAIFNTYFSPRGYTLVERTQIDRVIDEQNFQRGKLTQSQMVRVGQILNVSKVVIGDVNIVMNQYNVDVRVVNVESGTIAAKDGATWAPGSSYRTMMSQLGTRLAAKIAITQTTPVPQQPQYQQQYTYSPTPQPTPRPYVENANCGLNMKMVYVEGGTFQMGSNDGERDEKPVHSVTLDSYYIAECEVTQAQWQKITGTNPSYVKGDINRPVEKVSWEEAQDFCRELSRITGKKYRLPTEAQWEYAARGGKHNSGAKYSGRSSIATVAWYIENSGSTTHAVKQKTPNELGLYDMSGNVCEWCSDWYGSYSSSSQTNPTGPSSGSYRVIRGGCWGNTASYCRVADRNLGSPSSRGNYIGFRVVCLP